MDVCILKLDLPQTLECVDTEPFKKPLRCCRFPPFNNVSMKDLPT